MSKLPAVTLSFWIMKICATTLGETAGDLLSMTLAMGYASATLLLLSGFVLSLNAQLMARRYHPFLYWTVILATSTAGTTLSDYLDRTVGLGYLEGSALLFAALVTVLLLWGRVEGTIALGGIRTSRGEAFYWSAILVSNTLGTALGDFLADSSGLGFAGGAAVIAILILVIMLAYFVTSAFSVGLFWAAFVLTRPLGATLGDLMTKSPRQGGFGFGTVGSSAILASVLVALILFTWARDRRRYG